MIDQQQDHLALVSPLLRRLRQAIIESPVSAPNLTNSFWKDIATSGSPIIEPSAESDASLVTWVYRELNRPIASIVIVDPFSWKHPETRQFARLDGTDIWFLTWTVRNDLRGTYSFRISWVDGEVSDGQTDPLGRSRDSHGQLQGSGTSVLVMPNAAPLSWRYTHDSVPRGTAHSHRFRSRILDNERSIWVHTPADYDVGQASCPFIVIFDGEEPNHPAPELIDNLIAAGKIPPTVAILVDQIGMRDVELLGNPEFSRAIATELIPWLRTEYRISSDPADAILNGGSYGGLCSAYTALHHPDVFGNVIMHSPSCWVHPRVTSIWKERKGDMTPFPVGDPADTPLLIQEFRNNDRQPVRIWHEVGTVENGPPPARIWQTFGNRWLHDILVLKGYDTAYREYVGGHDQAWWRGTLADGLLWVFGQPEE